MSRDEKMRRRQKEVAEITKKYRAERTETEPSVLPEKPPASEQESGESEN